MKAMRDTIDLITRLTELARIVLQNTPAKELPPKWQELKQRVEWELSPIEGETPTMMVIGSPVAESALKRLAELEEQAEENDLHIAQIFKEDVALLRQAITHQAGDAQHSASEEHQRVMLDIDYKAIISSPDIALRAGGGEMRQSQPAQANRGQSGGIKDTEEEEDEQPIRVRKIYFPPE